MSLETETARDTYAGNNSTVTPYPITFKFFTTLAGIPEIIVTVRTSAGVPTNLALTTDYTLTGLGYPDAEASIRTLVAVPITSTVTITRNVPLTQTTEYEETDAFPAASHEQALDKLTMQVQQFEDGGDRVFRVTNSSPALNAITPVANTVLGLDASSQPTLLTPSALQTFLNLVSTVLNQPTKTWLNNAARATSVPDFVGQVGMQQDTLTMYMGSALTAGSWTATSGSTPGAMSITTAMLQDGVLSANVAGRAKMAGNYITQSHIDNSMVTGLTAEPTFEDAAFLLGVNAAGILRKFAGDVVVLPGSIVQVVEATPYKANTDLGAGIPNDDTKPQIGEGTQILTLPITPRYADSRIRLTFHGQFSLSGTNKAIAALFANAVTDCLQSDNKQGAGTSNGGTLTIDQITSPGSASAQTYTIRVGPSSGVMRMNGTTSGRLMGDSMMATLIAMEIKS